MTRMQHSIDVDRTPEALLAYASSPRRWPEWHPSSLRVDGDDGPLAAGARFEEDIRAGDREGRLRWDVVASEPRRWVAKAAGDRHGLTLTLTYECLATSTGTRFVRTLDYAFEGWTMQLVDRLVLRRKIDRESADSLVRLRDVAHRVLP